eukprot:SAG31_NODE_35345_length_324_cov_0.693333_2_plen_63_part_01
MMEVLYGFSRGLQGRKPCPHRAVQSVETLPVPPPIVETAQSIRAARTDCQSAVGEAQSPVPAT